MSSRVVGNGCGVPDLLTWTVMGPYFTACWFGIYGITALISRGHPRRLVECCKCWCASAKSANSCVAGAAKTVTGKQRVSWDRVGYPRKRTKQNDTVEKAECCGGARWFALESVVCR